MGWTCYDRAVRDPKAELDSLYTWDSDGNTNRVLISALVGREYYAAVERIEANGERSVWAAVALFETSPFGYKDMGEGMGPYARRCPRRILELLTPLDPATVGMAEEWRGDCWRNLGGDERMRQLAELKAGSPLRPVAGRTQDVDGLALFDVARQPSLI